MANAQKDSNSVDTLLATLNTDGATTTLIQADPDNNSMKVDDDTTGSDSGPTDAKRDSNSVPVIMAVSESDGTTPISLYANSSGQLLVDSN